MDVGVGSPEGFLFKTGSLEPKRGMPVGLVAGCEGGSMSGSGSAGLPLPLSSLSSTDTGQREGGVSRHSRQVE